MLTTEQAEALERGEPVEMTLDGKACIVLSREVYDRVKRLIEYDDSPLTVEEQIAALRHVGELAGWDDPEMDVYNDLDPRK